VVSATFYESENYGLWSIYDPHPRLNRIKLNFFYVRVLILRYDLSNVYSLHDIAIKDVGFEDEDIWSAY